MNTCVKFADDVEFDLPVVKTGMGDIGQKGAGGVLSPVRVIRIVGKASDYTGYCHVCQELLTECKCVKLG